MTTYVTKLVSFALLLISSFAFVNCGYAQVQYGGTPLSVRHDLMMPENLVSTFALTGDMLEQRKELSGVYKPGEALHAGFSIPAVLNPAIDGQWDVVDGTWHIWRVQLHSPEALATGLNFSSFNLHEDARLFVYDPDRRVVLGAFDYRNNNKNQVFSTAVIPGEYVILEYQEPYYPGKAEQLEFSSLVLESVIHLSYGGGLDVFGSGRSIGSAGDCQVNINCVEGNDWQDEKRGIARMLMRVGENYSWCTGSLINTTAQDATPYFLSAEHCGRNASFEDHLFWQFYFNLEHQGCSNESMPTYNMIHGAEPLSIGPLLNGSDFRLLLLKTTPPAHWRPYWNGWDRRNEGSNSGVGIHHPRGDAKKISTYTSALATASPVVSGQQMAPNSTWRVIWSPTQNGHGVSEGGSSGSPIFNSEKRIIGTLTGGSSSCDNPYGFDFYGKIWYHWDRNGMFAHQRLDAFLDPIGSGAEYIDGFDPYDEPLPAPGFLSASLTGDQQADIGWFAPGTAPNTDGWHSYVDSYTHLTWAGRERATVFDAHALGLNYPVHLKKVAHTFVEHSSYPWPDDRFRFKIYDTDGLTVLYESEPLTAAHLQQYVYELEESLTFYDYFYVAVRTEHSGGHPSTLMNLVNFGEGYSFSGSAPTWNVHNSNLEGSFAYLFSIYVAQEADEAAKVFRLSHLHQDADQETVNQQAKAAKQLTGMSIPDSYRIFRDNEIIHTAAADDEAQYTDNLPGEGFFRYHATATYNNMSSPPSNTAYVLNAGDCDHILNEWPYTEVFGDDFSEDCWITDSPDNNPWALADQHNSGAGTLEAFAGEQFYLLHGNGSQLDEWLILPEIDFSELEQPALRFMFNHYFEDVEGLGYLVVLASRAGESFLTLWDSRQHPKFMDQEGMFQWLNNTVDLTRLGGMENIRIAFQYRGSLDGYIALDQVELTNAAAIRYTLNVNVTPQYAGTVTGKGSYLAGESVLLKARPNVTYDFEAWMDGSVTLGSETELLFSMPATNKTLTARFNTVLSAEEMLSSDGDVSLFPNPARDDMAIVFHSALPSADISILGQNGRPVYRQTLADIYKGQQVNLSVGHLPAGIYVVHVASKKFNRAIKLIVTE